MSISISVQNNQSIRDKANKTAISRDAKNQPKEIYSSNVPLGLPQADE